MLLHVEAERLHFHTFMLGVHHQLHQLQQALPTVVGTSRAGLPVYRWARGGGGGDCLCVQQDPTCVRGCTYALHNPRWCADGCSHMKLVQHGRTCDVCVVCYLAHKTFRFLDVQ
jgi:hypothetical protein